MGKRRKAVRKVRRKEPARNPTPDPRPPRKHKRTKPRDEVKAANGKATQFKSPQTGKRNKGGRPKGSIGLTALLRKILDEKVTEGDHKGKTKGARLMALMEEYAGRPHGGKHLAMLLDRIEGPVPTKVVGGDEGEAPLVINIIRQEKAD